MKVAIVSHVLPPTWSGQATALERLLGGFDPTRYVLIRTLTTDSERGASGLQARTFDLSRSSVSNLGGGLRGRLRLARNLPGAFRSRTRGIAEIAAAECCGAIVACSGGDMLDIPAAYRAARRLNAQFFPYYFDYWSQQTRSPVQRRIAAWLEPVILRHATAVIVPNESLATELHKRFGAQCTVVRNACDCPPLDTTVAPDRNPSKPATIVYTGAVYEANYDAFRNLMAAIALTDLDVTLQLFTAQSARVVAAAGIRGPVEVHEHRPAHEIRAVQQRADALFLPLAFTSPYARLIQCSSPGKMCEYLASGRPVLVHAPKGAFVSEYIRQHCCGVVVDEPDPVRLAAALRRILEDNAVRARVVTAARERARADYDVRTARAAFGETVGLSSAAGVASGSG